LCKLVGEAGWEPITLARSSDSRVYVERFGEKFLTVFNDSPEKRTVTINLERDTPQSSKELISGRTIGWTDQKTELIIDSEDVVLIEIKY
jgi:hypothetical protein